jgi:hypothetical protein
MFLLQTADDSVKQMLVTASPVLCNSIRKTYENMCHTVTLIDKVNSDSQQSANNGVDETTTEVVLISSTNVEESLDDNGLSFGLVQSYPIITTYLFLMYA